jgi:hypothetical protein
MPELLEIKKKSKITKENCNIFGPLKDKAVNIFKTFLISNKLIDTSVKNEIFEIKNLNTFADILLNDTNAVNFLNYFLFKPENIEKFMKELNLCYLDVFRYEICESVLEIK